MKCILYNTSTIYPVTSTCVCRAKVKSQSEDKKIISTLQVFSNETHITVVQAFAIFSWICVPVVFQKPPDTNIYRKLFWHYSPSIEGEREVALPTCPPPLLPIWTPLLHFYPPAYPSFCPPAHPTFCPLPTSLLPTAHPLLLTCPLYYCPISHLPTPFTHLPTPFYPPYLSPSLHRSP